MTIKELRGLQEDKEENKLRAADNTLRSCQAHNGRFLFKVELDVREELAHREEMEAYFCIVTDAAFPITLFRPLRTPSGDLGLYPLRVTRPATNSQLRLSPQEMILRACLCRYQPLTTRNKS